MSAPEFIDAPLQRRRLALMLVVNLLCLLVAGAAAVGAFAYHLAWAAFVFAGALVVGFGAHLWLVLGVARPKGSI
jgi:hypothetical protein